MDEVEIRLAASEDSLAILHVHYDAVHKTAAADYDPEVLNIWSAPVDEKRLAQFKNNADGEIRLVAIYRGKVSGFGALVSNRKELRACYVDPDHGGLGIGRALVAAIERTAKEKGLLFLEMDSSLTAREFYQKSGYRLLHTGMHKLQGGVMMPCVRMRKDF